MDKLRINTFGRSSAHEAAVSQGFYAADQLEVELTVTQSSKAQMQELIDGVWDVVHTNADNVFWWAEDNHADLVIVAAAPSRPGQDLVVRPEIGRYEDLRGKPIAVDAAESGYATPLRLLLQEAGLAQEGRDYMFVEVGATQQRIDALRDGRGFGAMIGSAQAATLPAEGFRILDTINRLFTHYAGSTAVRRQWARDNPDLLVRYLRAHTRGAMAAEALNGPPEFDWDGLQEMLVLRGKVGLRSGPADTHGFADDSYYRKAVASIVSANPVQEDEAM